MQKWKIVAGLLLVFVLGALTGALSTGMVLKRHHPFFSRAPEGRKAFIMKRLTRKLDLTAEQKVRIEAIIDRVQIRNVPTDARRAPLYARAAGKRVCRDPERA